VFRLDDAVRARATMANDDLVDVLNDEIIRELIDTASDSGDPTVDVAVSVA